MIKQQKKLSETPLETYKNQQQKKHAQKQKPKTDKNKN